ncbi:MAG: mechanosensitive ion channel family protein [Actinomycetota bacterium]|nr:mechanosensitive ion channel family protein [Actinomycetota bacterium]
MPLALFAMTMAHAADVEEVCGPKEDAGAVCTAVFESTGNKFLAETSDVFVVRPVRIVLILVLAYVAHRLMRRGIGRLMTRLHAERGTAVMTVEERKAGGVQEDVVVAAERKRTRAETIASLLRSVASVAIWSVAAVMILSELEVNLGPLVAGAGVVGVALGFGAQNLVRDFVSGIFMLVEDQYGVGDTIDAGEATGVVEAISLRTTRVRSVDGTLWHLPNGQIDRVGNKSQQWSRALLDVAVAYETDIDHATAVIKRTADAMWADPAFSDLILEAPCVWGVEDLGADGMAIRLVVKTRPNEQWKVSRQLRARLKAAFDDAGIEIPFPQRTIWHRVPDGTLAETLESARS